MKNVTVQSGEFKIVIGNDGADHSVRVYAQVPNRGELCLGSFGNEFYALAFLRDLSRVLNIAIELSEA